MVPITPRIEIQVAYPVVTWVDVSEDVVGGIRAEWGIHGDSPQDRVADPGQLTFELDNSATNLAESAGYYSPGPTAFPVAPVAIGSAVRLYLDSDLFGSVLKWEGTITDLVAKPGARGRTVAVTCADWMDEAARAKITGLAVATDVQSDEAFETIADLVARQPPSGTLVNAGSDIYPFAFDSSRDESTRALGEFQKIALSELGQVYVSAGQLVFEGRQRRAGAGTIRFAMDEDEQIVGMTLSHGRDDIANRVQVTIHPRRVDKTVVVLFTLGSSLQVIRGTSVELTCQYRDPDQAAQRVGGTAMVAPVSGTDYSFSENEDGSGSDLTAQLTVTAEFGGNAAVVTVSNAGPYDGYIPAEGLQLRGKGLYDFSPVIADVKDQDSIDTYGEAAAPAYDMPYQVSPSNALDVAAFLLGRLSVPRTRVKSVSYIANWSRAVLEQALFLSISDRVSITAPSVLKDAEPYFVNGISLDIHHSGLCRVTYDLEPADTTQFWQLDVDGRTELDVTTVLGYGLFVPGWILDTSELGSDTFLS